MPKSKKRQPKRVPLGPGKALGPALAKTLIGPGGDARIVTYRPGRLKVDTETAVRMLTLVPPDFAVTLLPVVLLVDHLRGRPANVCVDACLLLKRMYGILGIDARITPVSVTVEPPGGGVSVYGRNARWEGDAFAGHVVLWLPGMQRLVDPTIQQFPEMATEKMPLIGRVGASSHAISDSLPPGSDIPIPRQGTQLMYSVLDTEAFVLDTEVARRAEQLNPKSAANIAGWALSIMGTPDIEPRIRSASFPRIHALLSAIGGADVDAGPDGYRFMLPGPNGQLVPTWIDDVPLPSAGG
ncbi:hypothetical protein AB0B10_25525 [Micromonospora arborensis]|uniref:hypothetical protein n=1 Tax=Micromonospora arborensis TaxID=2116518 RepID=UPI0034059DFE